MTGERRVSLNEVVAAAVAERFGLDPVDVQYVIDQATASYYGWTDGEMRAAVDAALENADPDDVAASIAAAIMKVGGEGKEAW